MSGPRLGEPTAVAASPARLARAAARGAAGIAGAALFGCLLVALSSQPLGEPRRDAGVRLALRTALAHVEICRDRTPEELAALPAHMRQPRVCEDLRADYRLELAVDGARVLSRRVEPPGIHRDRPLTVDELVSVAPGRRRLAVALTPLPATSDPGPSPPAWKLECTAEMPPGRILLVLVDGPNLRATGVDCPPGLSRRR